jgi:hypothetical protein
MPIVPLPAGDKAWAVIPWTSRIMKHCERSFCHAPICKLEEDLPLNEHAWPSCDLMLEVSCVTGRWRSCAPVKRCESTPTRPVSEFPSGPPPKRGVGQLANLQSEREIQVKAAKVPLGYPRASSHTRDDP